MTTNGDDLIFTSTNQLVNPNNFTALNVNLDQSLNGSLFNISGNSLYFVTNGITDNVGTNTISLPIVLGASQIFQNTAAGTTNTTSSGIAFGTNTLTVNGTGAYILSGLLSSTNGGIIGRR